MKATKTFRPLSVIAYEIYLDWKPVHSDAKDLLNAMSTLNSINDNYICDSGYSIVAYFLNNARTWKGDKAREIKKELNEMLKRS